MNTIEDALNNCLDMVGAGSSLEDCLSHYPGQRPELEPLLRTALALRQASVIPLRPAFRAEGRARVVGAMAALRSRSVRPPGIGWTWRYAIASLVIVFLLGAQVVSASAQSLPGETLYPVKRTVEQVRITLTFSPTAKAQLVSQFADERMNELVAVAQDSDLEDIGQRERFQQQVDQLVQSQAGNLEDVASLAGKDIRATARQAIASQVQQDFERQKTDLWQVVDKAPETAQPALRQAVEKATQGYEKALKAVATPEPRTDKVEGLLGTVRPQDRVVVILRDKQAPLTLHATPDSQIIRNGAAATLDALSPGDLVTTTYDRDSLTTSRIEARSPASASGERVEFTGTVESQQGNRWTISGRVVIVGPNTELNVREPVAGAQARVVAEAQADGSLLARKLDVRPVETPKRPEASKRVQFTGTIENLAPSRWLVSGRELVISQDTTIKVEGILAPGAQARVTAEQRPDGSLLAREIQVAGLKEQDRDRDRDRDKEQESRDERQQDARDGQRQESTDKRDQQAKDKPSTDTGKDAPAKPTPKRPDDSRKRD